MKKDRVYKIKVEIFTEIFMLLVKKLKMKAYRVHLTCKCGTNQGKRLDSKPASDISLKVEEYNHKPCRHPIEFMDP